MRTVTLSERMGSALILGSLFLVWLIVVVVITPYVAAVALLSGVFPSLRLQPEQGSAEPSRSIAGYDVQPGR